MITHLHPISGADFRKGLKSRFTLKFGLKFCQKNVKSVKNVKTADFTKQL